MCFKRSLWPPCRDWIIERQGRSKSTVFGTAAYARCGSRSRVGEEAMERERGGERDLETESAGQTYGLNVEGGKK